MKTKKYNVLSPDGFPIQFETTYTSMDEAYRAFKTWVARYEKQGYYSSADHGRIDLRDLEDFCQFITL